MPARRYPTLDDPRPTRANALAAALAENGGDAIARRDFLARMGATLALAGLGACTRAPREEIVPYVVEPREVRPGTARFYATASVLDGYATGLLVESHAGRPTKVEGNPEHPASLGAAGVFEQASVLSVYDPTRTRGVTRRGSLVAWEDVARALRDGSWVRDGGRGLWLVLEPSSSPTLGNLLDRIRERLPLAEIVFHSAVSASNTWDGARVAFGRVLEPRLALDRADVIVSLDSDFLVGRPDSLRLSRQFANRRAVFGAEGHMNRLYVVEPLYTVTGANADHRLRVRMSEVRAVAAALAAAVGVPVLPSGIPPTLRAPAAPHQKWIDAVARDLLDHRGRSVVLAGDAQPPEVHALAYALNAMLGNLGVTLELGPSPILDAGASSHGLTRLASALDAGDVDTLVVCGANPVYTSPEDRDLARLFARARQSAYLGLHDDETGAVCTYTIARAHVLESWGDARAFDGTLSIVQPLIEPLFGGRTELELLALFAGKDSSAKPYDLVRTRARGDLDLESRAKDGGVGSDAFERTWRRALMRGLVEGSATPATVARIDWAAIGTRLALAAPTSATEIDSKTGDGASRLELVTRLDPRVHDGRFANNAWLLELPSPIEKLTWTNAATLSTETATQLGIATGDEVVVRVGARAFKVPACIVPGQAEGTVGLTLGWGRSRGANLAHGRGLNAYALASMGALVSLQVAIDKTGARCDLPITQTERSLEGRDTDILKHVTLAAHRAASRTTVDRNGEKAKPAAADKRRHLRACRPTTA